MTAGLRQQIGHYGAVGNRLVILRWAALAGTVLMTAGRVLDLRWHATHDEFETGADQLQAHWLAWLGALILAVIGAVGMRRLSRSPGYVIVFVSALVYAPVGVWHFWLHNELRDPALPHVLIALSQLGLYVGTAFLVAGLALPKCRSKYISGRSGVPSTGHT